MFDPPMTKEEARAYRYNSWAGNPEGAAYNFLRCAWEVPDGFHYCQCLRHPGHGPKGLYCRQHAKKLAARKGKP